MGLGFNKGEDSHELQRSPIASTVTYGELAQQLARPASARAIGGAVGRNPNRPNCAIPPGSWQGGSLRGYGGGLERKRCLLLHECQLLPNMNPSDGSKALCL